jgi:hypothetical protein
MQKHILFIRMLINIGILAVSFAAVAETIITDAPLNQNWIKRGIILKPGFAGSQSSMFVSSPSVIRLENGRLRMYVWTADGIPPWLRGRHIILAAEANPANPFSWKVISKEPMVGPDPKGNIRDRGAGFPFVLPRSEEPWLMFYGTWGGQWELKQELLNRIGLALSHDQGLTWQVVKEDMLPSGPTGSFDAGAIPSAGVLRDETGGYMMWYTAAEKYIPFGNVNQGILHIGMARSRDGVTWDKFDQPVLRAREGNADPYEACLARPAVLKLDGVYHMWFGVYDMAPGSRPGKVRPNQDGTSRVGAGSYRIEYARGTDGVNWTRFADQPIMSLTPGGFDSRSQTYAGIIDMGEQIWLFYTGDDLGGTGIGLATLDKEELLVE